MSPSANSSCHDLGRREGHEHVVDVEARALDLAVEAELELTVGEVGGIHRGLGLARQVEIREHLLDQGAGLDRPVACSD